jgi:hypothetical protein
MRILQYTSSIHISVIKMLCPPFFLRKNQLVNKIKKIDFSSPPTGLGAIKRTGN